MAHFGRFEHLINRDEFRVSLGSMIGGLAAEQALAASQGAPAQGAATDPSAAVGDAAAVAGQAGPAHHHNKDHAHPHAKDASHAPGDTHAAGGTGAHKPGTQASASSPEHHAGTSPADPSASKNWVKPVDYKPDPAHPLSAADQKKENDYEKSVQHIKDSPEFKTAQAQTSGGQDQAKSPTSPTPSPNAAPTQSQTLSV